MADSRVRIGGQPLVEAGVGLKYALRGGLRLMAEQIMAEALIQVPKDTGVLERSAHIGDIDETVRGFNIEFGFGYGSEVNPKTKRLASDYVVPVHEIMEGHGGSRGGGSTHTPPTKAKFLEDPVLMYAPMMGRTLKAAVKEDSIRKWWRGDPLSAAGFAPRIGLSEGEKIAEDALLAGGGKAVRGAGGRFVRKFTK